MADEVTLATFTPLVGETFKANFPTELGLELVEAKTLPSRPGAPRQDPFSLVFRAPKNSGLWQGMLELDNERTGPMAFFLVPIGEDEEGMYFEALFN